MLGRRMAVVGGVASLLLAACGGGGGTTEGGATVPTTTGGGASIAVALGETGATHMYLRLNQSSVAAGSVTFTITNEGQKKHEFVILGIDTQAADLAVEGDAAEEPNVIDEAEDIEAGDTVSLTVDLVAGHYALICNEPHHYERGMFADLTVT